jgi:hypothetical protein
MAIPLISIAQLQHDPRHSRLDVAPMVNALSEYRRWPLQRDSALAEIEASRARTGLTGAQRAAMEAEMGRAASLHPWQRRNLMLQGDQLRAQTGLTGAQAAAARRDAEMRTAVLNALLGGNGGPSTMGATSWDAISSMLPQGMTDLTYTPSR